MTTEYRKVATLSEIPADAALQVVVDNKEIAIVRCEDGVFAVSDVCSHEHAFLSEGFFEGCQLECPLHGSLFDCKTGEALSLPATEGLPTFPVRIEGEDVLIGIET